MKTHDLLQDQESKRQSYLTKILDSKAPRKIIIAGPGTGKTFTFGEVLRKSGVSDNLAITFIRKLVADMECELNNCAEVKTFHSYCKKLLHEKTGRFDLVPFLTAIVESDASLLNTGYVDFDSKFQTLQETSKEVKFYLKRGDYYNSVSFNDSVFRLYQLVRDKEYELPKLNQIVVDEFQDFNPLEVAFIDELEKRGSIIIAGDDDQAVYRARNSSPDFLRQKYRSGKYEIFELPFCSRCPSVVVEATNAFIKKIIESGAFQSRIERPFVPYFEGKRYENSTYPKLIEATTTTVQTLGKFIISQIKIIPDTEIAESYKDDYPTVLVVGQRQYLNALHKQLAVIFSNVDFSQSKDADYTYADAYKLLLNKNSNLGWRLLAGLELSDCQLKPIIKASTEGHAMIDLLELDFISKHTKVIEVLRCDE